MINEEFDLKIKEGFFTTLINCNSKVLAKISISNECIVLIPNQEEEENFSKSIGKYIGKSLQFDGSHATINTKTLFAARLTKKNLNTESILLENAPSFLLDESTVIQDEESLVYFTLFGLDFISKSGSGQLCDKKHLPKLRAFTFEVSNKLATSLIDYFNIYFQTNQDPGKTTESYVKKKYLAITNPVGGTKDAHKKFHSITAPMLKLAGIEVDYFETTYLYHGEKIVKTSENIQQYHAIITNGGDGMIYEGLNGFLGREDYQQFKSIPLAILPGGTGNGLATSLGIVSFEAASFTLIRNTVNRFDILAVYSSPTLTTPRYGILDFACGFLNDIDDTTDKMRFMGPLRVDLSAAYLFARNKKYPFKVYYKPVNKTASEQVDNVSETNSPPENLLAKDGGELGEGWVEADLKVFFLAVTNVPYVSHNLKIAERSKYNSNDMSLVYDKDPKLGTVKISGAFLKEDENPGKGHVTSLLTEKNITNFIITSSDPKKPDSLLPFCRIDGEKFVRSKAFQVTVLPSHINFLIPMRL
ncbi:hypothetical protein K502DRAFT_368373 [Neoconidiobolus thromboides FSU 785]|nr:hypothetical protein K502DRAFT_368373 [Neoconidiobolus thromboides FSU 785]